MSKTLRATALSLVIVGGLAAWVPATLAHFALSRSAPEADSSAESPSEIRLWFTEEPAAGSVQIRLVEADEAGVHVMDVAQDPDDARSFYLEFHGTLAPGEYNVSWRGMGDDGHVVRDTYSFNVIAR